jgi:hypothetical protein
LELLSERRLELGPQRGDVDAHGGSSARSRTCRLVLNGHGARWSPRLGARETRRGSTPPGWR